MPSEKCKTKSVSGIDALTARKGTWSSGKKKVRNYSKSHLPARPWSERRGENVIFFYGGKKPWSVKLT